MAQVVGPRDGALDGIAELLAPLRHVDHVADAGPHRRRQQPVPALVPNDDDRDHRSHPADELGETERVGVLDLGREHQDVDLASALDQQLFGGRDGLDPAEVLGLALERAGQRGPERLRRSDGDDRALHGYFVFSGRKTRANVSGSSSVPASSGASSER